MKHCCRECHFLAKSSTTRSAGVVERTFFSWTNEERLEGKVDNEHLILCCQRGVWDTDIALKALPLEKIRDKLEEEMSGLEEVIDKNRKDDCFFIEYSEGMSFDGATELHRIRYENRNLKRSLLIATWGLYISATAASLNFIGFDNFKKGGQIISEWISAAFKYFA